MASKFTTVTVWFMIGVLCSQATVIPELEYSSYVREGDLKIGGLIKVKDEDPNGQYCRSLADSKQVPYNIQMAEMMNFGIQQVNNRSDLLPNVTLGFVVMDSCGTDVTGLAMATFFVDDPRCEEEDQPLNQSWRHHKVVGIIGPLSSRSSVMVSSFLGLYQIPTLSLFATSDDLSDKSRYNYFSRLSPSDGHQVVMFMDLLQQNNWTYISLIYSEGSYGENAAKKTERSAEENNVCIAYQKRIPSIPTAKDFNAIARSLAANRKARVVILFLQFQIVTSLFNTLSRHDLDGHFLWLCGDFLAYLPEPHPGLSGAIYGSGVMELVPGFEEFYGSLSPWKVPDNPWMNKAWEYYFSCSWQPTNGEKNCNQFQQISDSSAFKEVTLMSSKVYEGVQVFALALHALIAEKCPEVFMDDKIHLDACIDGPALLSHLRRVNLADDIRPVQFDSIGDLIPVFDMQQVLFGEDGSLKVTKIGRWNEADGLLSESAIQFSWMLGVGDFVNGTPESVCSKPCGPKEYVFQMELPCCWECRACRDNEIIASNVTGCELCPEFTWPDDDTQTVCQLIPVIYLKVQDAIGMGLLVMATIGIALSLLSLSFFIRYRHHRLIKASSRELNNITLLGLGFAFVGVLAFLARPSGRVCWTRTFVFSVAVSMIFSPILVKAVRIYRIFQAGKMGQRRPRFISSSMQIAFTSILVSVQVLLVIVTNQNPQPSPGRHMPVVTKKYVELVCHHSLSGFLLPMIYNILIIVVCAVVGFLTRKLPENFNESWFSFISVATTLFMWMVFVPSYYNAFYAYHKAALLALCLILNAFVTTTCLFLSKIYAVLFVNETNMQIATMNTTKLCTVAPANPTQPSMSIHVSDT